MSSSQPISGTSRQPNMTPFEDEILCTIYAKYTARSIEGNSISSGTFWDTVKDEYNVTHGITITRTRSMLSTRYNHISHQIMLYIAKLSHQMNNMGSGTNEFQAVTNARDAYRAETNKHFTFDNCYQILKDLPKFDLENTAGNDDSPTPVREDDTPGVRDVPDRPPGRKGEKQRARQRARSDNLDCNTAVLKHCEDFNAMFKSKQEWKNNRALKFDSQMDAFIQMKRADQLTKKQDQLVRLGREQSYIMELDMTHMNEIQNQFLFKRFNELTTMVVATEAAISELQSNSAGSSGPSGSVND